MSFYGKVLLKSAQNIPMGSSAITEAFLLADPWLLNQLLAQSTWDVLDHSRY